MTGMFQDLRYAARGLRKAPGFTLVAVLTLALGIGATSAMFAIVDAVLLHPMVADQDRVVRIWKRDFEQDQQRISLSYPEFRAWREQARSVEGLAAINYFDAVPTAIIVDGRTAAVALTPVSADFFNVLRAGSPLHGRWLQQSDELAGAELVAVVSERFWRRAAASDPEFVGQRLTRVGGGRRLRVIGIAPVEFEYPLGTDVWAPITSFFAGGGMGGANFNQENRQIENRLFRHFELLGRLAPGSTPDEAKAELEALHRLFSNDFPDGDRRLQVAVEPLLDTVLGNSRYILRFLFAGAVLIFVIAGVNVATLLLMRASGRQTEVAVRMALGASRGQLTRQIVVESLLLGGLGVTFAFIVAQLFLGISLWIAPDDIPRLRDAAINVRVFGFSMGATVMWVLFLGTAPIWSRSDAKTAPRSLRIFTIAEISAAVVIAISAGLLIQSFLNLQKIDRGFQSNNLAVITLLLPEVQNADARTRLNFFKGLLTRVETIPGIVAASTIHMAPGSGTVGLSAPMVFEGQTTEEARGNPLATWEPVLPSHFRTLGIPVTQGRAFTNADDRNGMPVAIVSEAVARRYWPGHDAVGKRLQVAADSKFPWATVVGVVGDTRYRELTKSWMTVYFPADQFFFFQPKLVVRTASDPEALIPVIRQTIRAYEPNAAVEWIEPMDTLLAREVSRQRTALAVGTGFALIAILLAAVGVYGVMSYDVRSQRHELAVRSALGAGSVRLFGAVLCRSLLLGGAGALIGVVSAISVTHTVRSLLFEVGPIDLGAFAAGVGTLLAIVLIASCVPARRAARVDPLVALRYE